MAADNRYSRFVNWMKVLLPLAALALLSTLFLFSRGPSGPSDIPFAEIEAVARDQRLSGPAFSGVADEGSVIALSAESAQPAGVGGLTVTAPRARIESLDGTLTEILAGTGEILENGRAARLEGDVTIETSSGYTVETTGIAARIDSGRIETLGPVTARAPFGALDAGQMVIETPDGGTGQRMLFTGGVDLIYRPQRQDP